MEQHGVKVTGAEFSASYKVSENKCFNKSAVWTPASNWGKLISFATYCKDECKPDREALYVLPTFLHQSKTDCIYSLLLVLLSLSQVVVPTRVGQMYVYDTGNTEQDEYDVPRNLPTSQDIYDVPPTRGQYNQQVTEHKNMLLSSSVSDQMRYNDH